MSKPTTIETLITPSDLRWYGAKGDGVTNDTAAVQAWIDSLGDSGGRLYAPSGIYMVDPINIGGAGDPRNAIIIDGDGRESIFPVASHAGAWGTIFKARTGGQDAIFNIRNCDRGGFNNVGFYGNLLALNGVKFRHEAADARAPYQWQFSHCYFGNAFNYNVLFEGTGADGYGDFSGTTFFQCMFGGSEGSPTVAHVRNEAQYTFGITFIAPWAAASTHPTRFISMQSGTATVVGGQAGSFPDATFHYDAGVGKDPPAMLIAGIECQGSNKFLVSEVSATVGRNQANRSTVITGVLADDINPPIETEMIVWDIGEQATLVLDGCNIFGDVNITVADANVIANGCVLYNAAEFTGHTERVYGTWVQNSTPRVRMPTLPDFADNAAALLGGLVLGDVYRRTTDGALMVVF